MNTNQEVPPEVLALIAISPYTLECRKVACGIGVAQALSDNAMCPEDFDFLLSQASKKEAELRKKEALQAPSGTEIVNGLFTGLGSTMFYSSVLGGALGLVAGSAGYKVDRRLRGVDDQDTVNMKARLDALAASRDSLAQELESRGKKLPDSYKKPKDSDFVDLY
jgi:hypothetical protein